MSRPTALFSLPDEARLLAMSADGQRFLVATRSDSDTPVTLLLNWAGASRR